MNKLFIVVIIAVLGYWWLTSMSVVAGTIRKHKYRPKLWVKWMSEPGCSRIYILTQNAQSLVSQVPFISSYPNSISVVASVDEIIPESNSMVLIIRNERVFPVDISRLIYHKMVEYSKLPQRGQLVYTDNGCKKEVYNIEENHFPRNTTTSFMECRPCDIITGNFIVDSNLADDSMLTDPLFDISYRLISSGKSIMVLTSSVATQNFALVNKNVDFIRISEQFRRRCGELHQG